MQKKHITQIISSLLMIIVISLSIVTISNINKINELNGQIDTLKDINEKLEEDDKKNYVILTYIDKTNDTVSSYLVNKNLDISVYDYLLSTKDFNVDDFASWDSENYYFDGFKTDVLELMNDEEYYEIGEYTTLVKGLQAVIMNKNYTVVKSDW